MLIELLVTICLIVFFVLTALAVKIANYIVDYKQLGQEFDQQQFILEEQDFL